MHKHLAQVACLFAALCLSGSATAERKASIALVGGKVFTANQHQPWAEAVAMDGREIVAVGTTAEVMRHVDASTRVISLGGKLVIPGLNDTHLHVPQDPAGYFINNGSFIPGPGPSLDEVLELIRDATTKVPAGTWLFGIVGDAILADPDLHRRTFDAVAPNHPVHIAIWAGHGTYLNSMAMRLAGISETEPDPFAGFYERYPGTNIVNGNVHEYAEHKLRRFMRSLVSPEQRKAQFLSFANAEAKWGVTSIGDFPFGDTKETAEDVLRGLALPIRVRTMCFPLTPAENCDGTLNEPGSLVTSSGLKWILDGSPIERYAFMRAEYSDRPGWFGFFNLPIPEFQRYIEESLRGSKVTNQLLLHAVGDATIDTVIAGMRAVAPAQSWKNRRVRLEHVDMLTPDQVVAFKELGIVVVQNPLHFGVRDTMAARYGEERLRTAQPVRSLIEAGIPVAFATDSVMGPSSPFLDMMLATLHPTNPAEAVTMEQAVTLYTLGSAYAENQENHKGSLEKGKLADLAVLSQDIFNLPSPFAILGTESLMTITDGRIVYDAGVLH